MGFTIGAKREIRELGLTAWRPRRSAGIPAPAAVAEYTGLWSRCDVLDVPAATGRRALPRLERLGLPLGPVALAPHGRAWFFVAPGAAAELPELLYRMGWDGAPLDLRGLGAGHHVTAPTAGRVGLGPVRWLRVPGAETTCPPPHARLLLGTLAYFCHRCHQP